MIDDWAIALAGALFKTQRDLCHFTRADRPGLIPYYENGWQVSLTLDEIGRNPELEYFAAATLETGKFPPVQGAVIIPWEFCDETWFNYIANKAPEVVKVTGDTANEDMAPVKSAFQDWFAFLRQRKYQVLAITYADQVIGDQSAIATVTKVERPEALQTAKPDALIAAKRDSVAINVENVLRFAIHVSGQLSTMQTIIDDLQSHCEAQGQAMVTLQERLGATSQKCEE